MQMARAPTHTARGGHYISDFVQAAHRHRCAWVGFDPVKALRRFTVRAHLPARLNALAELSTNLRWSWHPSTQDLFEHIDPLLWTELERDPVAVLGAVAPARLEELAADEHFLAELDAAEADLHDYLARPLWYQNELAEGRALPSGIGYFSMEFGVTEVLPNYSGGLGILAGDHLKAASDLGLPLIGVGLLYRSGYFRQSLTADGWQAERYPSLDPHGLPLRLLTDDGDSPVLIHVSMPGSRVLRARVWIAQVGRVPLLLLDSDIADNDPELRGVTDRLYGGDQDHRIKQEILAGIGGVRAIRAYTRAHGLPDPEVFHMNEGHAGFLGVERIRELVTSGTLDFDAALAAVRAGTVFTTHTPVPAGIDRFPADLVRHYFASADGGADSALLPGLPMDRILALGGEADASVFNMAHMGLRLGQRANGVSKLHGIVSREMFNDLWPGFDASEVPIGSVTNGVHAPTWSAREWAESGPMSSDEVWSTRNTLRAQLVDEVRRRVRRSALERGSTEAEISWTANVFDPNILTVGFARRVPTYKRLTLMLREPERLRAMLLDPVRPVQLVVAGKSHPADDGGKALIQQIVRFADQADVRHRIVFLPDYDMSMARFLYWGCDVWLNNPLRPLEACGTSGMKSALNGGLNLSIRDGWWDEMYDGENGWAIPTADGVTDDNRRDDLEAAALYELLEQAVLPKFYDRGDDGVPSRWIEMVRHTLEQLGPKVLASRMVQDYTLGYYAPAAESARAASAENNRGASDVASYRRRVEQAWSAVKVTRVDSDGLPDTPVIGADLSLRADVDLGGLDPSDVVVQAVVGRVDEEENLTDIRTTAMTHVGTEGGEHIYAGETLLPHSGAVGYTVRVLPHHHGLASDAELGLVATP
jgi:starch phosphorylase